MKKIFNIIIVFAIFLSCLNLRQEVFALEAGKILVSPVNVPTVHSSYGVYPQTIDMIANDIINNINKYSSFDVPDLNSAKDLIESYGMTKDYKKFLMDYRDNKVIDYKTCNAIQSQLGIDKILLVSGGYDVQNMFLNRSNTNKLSDISSTLLPLKLILSKDLITMGIPYYIYNRVFDSVLNEDPIEPTYMLNVQLALVDTATGLVVWDNSYNEKLPASDFGNPINSFGENVISSEKLKKFSDKIAKDTSFSVFMATKDSRYATVKSKIVSTSDKPQKTTATKNKITSKDGKMTKDGHPSSLSNSYTEKQRKESYKKWVEERAKLSN